MENYIISFYWAISTICTVGFGDIIPTNGLEIFFNLLWILVGAAFYSYTLGTLTTILNNLNRKNQNIALRFAFLREMTKEIPMENSLLENFTI